MSISAFIKEGEITLDANRLGDANASRERRYRQVLLISDELRGCGKCEHPLLKCKIR